MTRTSCITHSSDVQLVLIRDDYMGICDQDHCAAALLNDLEYWTNIKLGSQKQAEIENSIAQAGGLTPSQDVELWIYKSHEEFQAELLNLFGLNKIGSGLAILKGKGFISTRNNPRFGWDRTVQYFFHVEAVQIAIKDLELNPTSLKIKASKASKVKNGSVESKAAIPQDTPQDTPQTKSATASKSTSTDKKLPKRTAKFTRAYILAYADCVTTNMNLLVAAWYGVGSHNNVSTLANYEGQIFIEAHEELERLHVSTDKYPEFVKHVKTMQHWQGRKNPVQPSEMVKCIMSFIDTNKPKPAPVIDPNKPQTEAEYILSQLNEEGGMYGRAS